MQNHLSYYRQLLEKYLDGVISVEEANTLFDFIGHQSAESQKLLEEFGDADLRQRFIHLENIDDAASRRMFARLTNSITDPGYASPAIVHRVHFFRKRWFQYAAAVLLIIVGAVSFYMLNNGPESALADTIKPVVADIAPGTDKAILTLEDGSTIVLDEAANGNLAQQGNTKVIKLDSGRLAYNRQDGAVSKAVINTLSVPRGGQYALTLSDGTRVWLNAASSIKYPTVFEGRERSVEISGEAYLEIAKNSRQPFVVKANGTEVLVLGTRFNVNAYAEEDAVRTTLVDGSVKVRMEGASEATLLQPGQQAELGNNSGSVKVATVDTEQVLAWRNGLFSFNNADIITIMRQLARWYDINIIYENGVPEQRFFGEMNRNLSLSQVLKGLEATKVHFRLEGRNLIVMP